MAEKKHIIIGQTSLSDRKLCPFYLYRHIRKDSNEVFYIGIGKKPLRGNVYQRAFSHKRSNDFWKSIVSKTDFEVEIVLESDNREYVQQKEMEFISLYGRRDKGSGVLCNLTDGGDSCLNVSRHSIEKKRQTSIKNGEFEKMIDRIKKHSYQKGSKGGPPSKCFAYTTDGMYLGEFDTRKNCGQALNMNPSQIVMMARKKTSFKGIIVSNDFLGKTPDFSTFHCGAQKNKTVKVTDIITGEEKIFSKARLALESLGISKRHFYRLCAAGGSSKTHSFKYI
jgi:hypothetical protein